MTDLRNRLHISGLRADVVDFACDLIELTEFDDRLPIPTAQSGRCGLELVYVRGHLTLVLQIVEPGCYRFTAIEDGEEVLNGGVYGIELIQTLRNLFFWLWKEHW